MQFTDKTMNSQRALHILPSWYFMFLKKNDQIEKIFTYLYL